MWFGDRLANLITGLGTAKDKSAATVFAHTILDRVQLEAMYRGDWLARKIVDIIPFDMTREWRDWQADDNQIERLEAEEKRLGLRDKTAEVLKRDRLYGGACLFLGMKDGATEDELRVESVKQGDLAYVHVLAQHEVTSVDLIRDPLSPYYGEPTRYEISSGERQARIHPSRIIRFVTTPVPDLFGTATAWGDPVLHAVYDAVQHAASSQQHVAGLLPDLKNDVISVPGLSEHLATKEGTARVQSRFASASLIRSMHNVLLLEGGPDGAAEKWEQRQINFANFPELLRMFLQVAAGAADIPVTRLLGQAPSGLNATGDSDTRNYYDHVAAQQAVVLGPRLDRLDEVLIRSALGTRPPEIHYRFAPLWQIGETEKADIALKLAQTIEKLQASNLIPDEVLAEGLKNRLIEDSTFPGIEAAYDEYGDDPLAGVNEEPTAPPERAETPPAVKE